MSTEDLTAFRWRLRAVPRKRYAASPERCSMCGRSIVPGQQTVRLMAGPVHVGCEPGGTVAASPVGQASS